MPVTSLPCMAQAAPDAGYLGTPLAYRRVVVAEQARAAFLRPLSCSDCGDQFFPSRVPAGLPRCSACEPR